MIEEPKRRRILVIDDNDAIHGDFRKTLEQNSPTERLAAAAAMIFDDPVEVASPQPLNFEVESALQGKEGYEKVQAAVANGCPYALAFVDMRMPPGWDGVETIKHLWQADPELQVVICTAYSDYSWDQINATLGQTDRLLILKKPFDAMEICQLASSLTEKWKLKRQASLKLGELEKMVHDRTTELRRLALTDRLTSLPNRFCLTDLLLQSAQQAQADPTYKFAVHFIDFDRFKIINDSLGHDTGDQLLMGIADRLRLLLNSPSLDELAGAKSIAARLGGDEFVILQRGITSVQDAVTLAEKLLAVFNNPYYLGEHELHSTASIGIATNIDRENQSHDLLRDADSAMYRAKALGKARYVLFTPDMHKEATARLTLEADLRRALDKGEFCLHYQPVVSLTDARLVGFEALLRWNHPQRGMILPGDFIPLAEETRLIIPLGQWVIHEAARQLQDWTTRFPEAAHLTMSVNCSRRQLTDPQLLSVIAGALSKNRLAPARFNLEITESIVMTHPEESRQLLDQLIALGISLYMDDFGTGYSSLNCLHTLPLSVLKIDRSFIRNVSERRDYAAVIDAIVALAHNLHMKVVAEGVETADHAAMLCALDCDEAQGFFFAKPLSVPDAEAFILSRAAASHQLQPVS
jgi:diguanylate cyclase (GGDEF)-like protein